MKKWLQNNFLPLWAKETLLAEKRRLEQENREQQQKINELKAYIQGMQSGLRTFKRIRFVSRGGEE
jgi:hypothetical protein